jgi:PilZ domain
MTELPPKSERRPKARRRVLLGGYIVHSEGTHSFKTTIRNISDTGARVTVPRGELLPPTLYLIDVRAQAGHEATLMWVKGGEAGLAFKTSFDMNALNNPGLAFLKHFWALRE